MTPRKRQVVAVGFGCVVLVAAFLMLRDRRNAAIEGRLAEIGPAARARLAPAFESAGVVYPPQSVVLVADKAARTLTLHGGAGRNELKRVHTWPVLGMSGTSGPKLREGDLQVPEGFYRIELLNPQSSFHVSLRLDYPNAFDRARAGEEGRDRPGSDIYIHGGTASIGCLAMGDPAAEELFTLAADTGLAGIEVIITPGERVPSPDAPPWVAELYRDIERVLAAL